MVRDKKKSGKEILKNKQREENLNLEKERKENINDSYGNLVNTNFSQDFGGSWWRKKRLWGEWSMSDPLWKIIKAAWGLMTTRGKGKPINTGGKMGSERSEKRKVIGETKWQRKHEQNGRKNLSERNKIRNYRGTKKD